MNRWMLAVLTAALWLPATLARAAEAPSAAPTRLYVVAPDGDCTWETNVLPVEAALRAVAAEVAASGGDAVFVPVDQRGGLAENAYPRLTAGLIEDRKHTWAFSLEQAGGKSAALGEAAFEWGTFEALVLSVVRATESVALLTRAAMNLPQAAKPSKLSGANEESLAKALEGIVENGPDAAIAEAARIDAVLTANPRSPDALCAAAWPTCVLGTGELYGCFQLRNRWLAVPLSWWVEARLCGAGETERGRLTAAWVALLCGFPEESRKIVEPVKGSETERKLARALTMFATRDWREMKGEVLEASAVEVMAWLWAIQQTGMFDSNKEKCLEVARVGRSPWFFPVYGVYDVGAGHALTPMMMAAAGYRVYEEFLNLEAVDEGRRGALKQQVERLARASDSRWGDEAIALGVPTKYAVRFVDSAIASAVAAPDGPRRTTGSGTTWQSLSPWAWAQPAQGIFYTSVYLRVVFVGDKWCVAEIERAFVGAMMDAHPEQSPIGLYFAIGRNHLIDETEKWQAAWQGWLKTEMGREAGQFKALSTWEFNSVMGRWRAWAEMKSFPCGAWQAEQFARYCSGKYTPMETRRAWYDCALSCDPRTALRSNSGFYGVDPGLLTGTVDTEPYNLLLIYTLGTNAWAAGNNTDAARLYEGMVKLAPQDSSGYSCLAYAYKAAGDLEKAVAALREGMKACPDSVGRSNMISTLAEMLVESGRVKEALPIAKEASQSGSGAGLYAYAKALIADGRVREGLAYYKMAADRYPGSVDRYLTEASVHDVPSDQIIAEARGYIKEHGPALDPGDVLAPLIQFAHFGVAEELLRGPCSFHDLKRDEGWLGILNLVRGDYAAAAEAFEKAADAGYLTWSGRVDGVYISQQCYIAALMGRRETLRKKAFDWLVEREDVAADVAPIQDYITGRADREAALKAAEKTPGPTINLYWVFAVEADAAGRRDEAMKWYKRCTEHPLVLRKWAGRFSRRRLEALEKGALCPPAIDSTDREGAK